VTFDKLTYTETHQTTVFKILNYRQPYKKHANGTSKTSKNSIHRTA